MAIRMAGFQRGSWDQHMGVVSEYQLQGMRVTGGEIPDSELPEAATDQSGQKVAGFDAESLDPAGHFFCSISIVSQLCCYEKHQKDPFIQQNVLAKIDVQNGGDHLCQLTHEVS